ncbi:sigma-E processing peptidase SpoIIGA [Clostridium perfringens]|uniref:sigma-E processing peptidase SpoIIGA n=1 Tax=Clostridium perfringens TaxID=1502 RepID=UPI00241310EC|nr:sigma-E processing peptidase SpoIIGA [Clostridium perfringens]MDK0696548.1 sigma-E processing peptidase SpoIIGA [Clostridium perfringens]
MTVYIDIVMLENFLINFFLLYLTLQTLKDTIIYKRIILASFLGAIYTLFVFIPGLDILTSLPLKLLFSLLMITIISERRELKTIIKRYITFLVITFAFCGTCFMFALVENQYNISESFIINDYSTKSIIFSLIISYILVSGVMNYFKNRAIINNFIYDLDVCIDSEVVNIKAFLDTGNGLVEPATALPVIIAEREKFRGVNIKEKDQFRIPYKVVDGNSGYMKGIKIDNIKLCNVNGETMTRDAILCFCDNKLSKEGEYEALLSRGII